MRTFGAKMRCGRREVLGGLAGVVVLAACRSRSAPRPQLRVAAASDLARALPKIGAAFGDVADVEVQCTFGSSGLLAKQIAEGAPFDVFASADVAYVDRLLDGGHARAGTKSVYARGRLVAFTRRDAALHPSALAELSDPRYAKIALANPAHAPYGRAAKEALTKAGVLPAGQGRLVLGENVQQALQFATSGNAEVALVSASLVQDADGVSLLVDASLHAPIEQAAVVTAAAPDPELARRFVAHLSSSTARGVLTAYGFELPAAS